jgi:hypothetical protein
MINGVRVGGSKLELSDNLFSEDKDDNLKN